MNGKPERNEQKAGKKEIGGTIGDNTLHPRIDGGKRNSNFE